MPACILNVMLKTKHMNTLLSSLCSHLDLKPEHTELLNERDTSDVWRQFAIWSLVDPDYGVIRLTRRGSRVHTVIQRVADLYIQKCKDADAWKAAYDAAWYAAWSDSAGYGARAACDAAITAAAAWSAWSAYGAAAAYAPASTNAVIYADIAAEAAKAVSNAAAASTNYYERMADKLVELIKSAPLKESP